MKTKSILICLQIICSSALIAQQTIALYDGLPPNSKPSNLKDSTVYWGKMEFMMRVVNPDITIYLPEKSKSTGKALIICPGGGYSGLATKHEGTDVAKKMAENGIAGIVLRYRLPNSLYVNNKEIVPLQDAQRAIQLVRENAKKWGINPNKIGLMGNSAGGHLAATAGTHFQKSVISNPKNTSLRPDFLVLNYPVISFADSLTHLGSRMNLVGEIPIEELNAIMADWQNSEKRLKNYVISKDKIKEYSNELQVTALTPPTFITHAVDDNVVPIQNSLLFVSALQQNKVPVETFFYAKGGHGYGMNNVTSQIQWVDDCIKWIKKR